MNIEQKKEIEKICMDIKSLKNFAKDIETEITEKENRIKEIMDTEKETDVKTDMFHVVWNIVLTNTFDKKACEKAYPEIVKQYTIQKESRPFKIL